MILVDLKCFFNRYNIFISSSLLQCFHSSFPAAEIVYNPYTESGKFCNIVTLSTTGIVQLRSKFRDDMKNNFDTYFYFKHLLTMQVIELKIHQML